MLKNIKKILATMLMVMAAVMVTGCDPDNSGPVEIWDDVGEIDVDARDRAYADRLKKEAEMEKQGLRKVEPARPDFSRVAPRVPAPAPIDLQDMARRERAEIVQENKKIDKYIRHHSANVGEIELEY